MLLMYSTTSTALMMGGMSNSVSSGVSSTTCSTSKGIPSGGMLSLISADSADADGRGRANKEDWSIWLDESIAPKMSDDSSMLGVEKVPSLVLAGKSTDGEQGKIGT